MGGDLTLIVMPGYDRASPVQVAARERFPAYVYAGSRTVPLVTPAFQTNGMQNFNVAVPFSSGACGSLGCHSVASPPRGRLWRLSPLVVPRIISMIVRMILQMPYFLPDS